jgi:hypothetical protein
MAQQPSRREKQAAINQSRQVSQPRKKTAPTKARRRSTATLLTWGGVGIVVLIVIGLVLYSVLGSSSSSPSSGNGYEKAPGSIVNSVTQIPLSVYNTVGINSSVVKVSPPTAISGQTPLTFPNANGVEQPGILYMGAEYCPFCAAERWSMAAAISRFGTLSGLGLTTSSSTDVFPKTPSVTFVKAKVDSQYFTFKAVEQYSNIPLAGGQAGYVPLQKPSKVETAIMTKFDSSQFFPNTSPGSIPFIDIGNQFLVSGSSFSPSILQGLTRDQIAAGLSDSTNPATQAIVATANYLTASICQITKGQPGSVCSSKGVQDAAKAMKISF